LKRNAVDRLVYEIACFAGDDTSIQFARKAKRPAVTRRAPQIEI
jgi:hypothetical protein